MADVIALPARQALLPRNRTPYETGQSLVSAARRPLPAHLVQDVWDPATCPLDLIQYQCAGLGLEIWDDSWPEAKQRAIYADLWRLKRNKTKLKGISAYLDLVGASLVAAHVPKQKFFWSGGQSDAQRAATIAEMPQIRIYAAVKPQPAPLDKKFWSGAEVKQFWQAGRTWRASNAATLYAGRATYEVDGVETPVTLRGIDEPLDASIQVELTAPASVAKLFWGRGAWGHAAYVGSDAGAHILAITPDPGAPLFAVPTGLVPSTVRPVKVFDQATASVAKLFWGRGAWSRSRYAWLASDALDHVYDRITLMDPSRAAPSRQPYSFWGYSRFGRRPYTAELLVDVPLERPGYRFGWGRPWGRTFWGRTDMTPFWNAIAAVKASKAVRDTVYLNTALYQPISFTPGLRFGDPGFTQFGSYRKAT